MSNYELRHITEQEDDSVNVVDHQGRRQQQQSASGDRLPDVVLVGSSDGKLLLDSNGQPVDKFKIVFFILLLHGIGTLMPWNMFINAEAYFRTYKLTPTNSSSSMDVSPEELDSLRNNFLSYLGLASQVPNVLFNGLNLLVNMGSGNLKMRVNLTLALEGVVFLVTIILAVVDSSKWPGAFFYVTMISVVFLNMASGIYQNCIFGTGAKFPGNYTNAILIGSNLSGTFTSTINLLSIWLAPAPQLAATYYFITALFIILICIISYNLLPINPFFRHYDSGSDAADRNKTKNELEIATTVRSAGVEKDTNDIPDSLRRTVDAMVPRPESDATANSPTFVAELKRKFLVFKQCWPQCLNVFLTFYVTLALFPAVMADIQRKQDLLSDKYFTSFACFFLFNIFAMIGNLVSGWTTWPGRNKVWLLVVSRFIFVPFFLFCNFKPTLRKWPVLITNDIVYMLGNIIFAASSGYLSSLCMIFASNNLKPEDAPTGGMLAAFFLVFGIFLGINSSFLLTWIVQIGG